MAPQAKSTAAQKHRDLGEGEHDLPAAAVGFQLHDVAASGSSGPQGKGTVKLRSFT